MVIELECVSCDKKIVLRLVRNKWASYDIDSEAADHGWRDDGNGWQCESCRDHFQRKEQGK